MDIEAYKENLKDLMPQGLAWNREKETTLDALAYSFAVELARIDSRIEDLLREAYPLLSSELLADWERVTGLPEPCVGAVTDLQLRRMAVHEKLGRRGGQSVQYFINLANSYGFAVSIEQFRQFRAGQNSAGDPVYGDDYHYAFRVHAPEVTIRTFKAGQNSAGDPLRSWGNELLECIINRLKPAYTHAIFAYDGEGEFTDEFSDEFE